MSMKLIEFFFCLFVFDGENHWTEMHFANQITLVKIQKLVARKVCQRFQMADSHLPRIRCIVLVTSACAANLRKLTSSDPLETHLISSSTC